MSSNNILEPIPAALNDYLLKYSKTILGDIPAAPNGFTNVVFQKDQFGNISAYATSGGSSLSLETNGVANSSQSLLNLAAGTNVTLAEASGTVTINSTGQSVGTAGQIQKVGSATGSLAASILTDTAGENIVFSAGALGSQGALVGPFTNAATLDDTAGTARLISWGPNSSTPGGVVVAGITSNASFTDIYMSLTSNAVDLNINGVTYFSLGPSLVTLGVSGVPTVVDTLQINNPASTTSATAGAATALPATPAGYLAITLGGVAHKIAYY